MNDFILPDIGEGIVECELLKWLVAEGDTVIEDQPIAEVMTDKATVEIPAMHNGIVSKLYYKEGDIAKVHEPLFAMQTYDESFKAPEASSEIASLQTNIPSASLTQVTAMTANMQQIESFILPDIGEGIVECEIMQWLVSQGDVVAEDQVVVEVMTDKAVVEIPAKYNGKIVKLHYQKGDIAGVHTPLFDQAIDETGEEDMVNNASTSFSDKFSEQTPVNKNVTSQLNNSSSSDKQGGNYEAPIEVSRAIASPAVRRLAKENGISLNDIRATGPKGRVLKQDVIQTIAGSKGTQQGLIKTETSSALVQAPVASQPIHGSDRVESIKGISAAMAKQMMASVSTIPHFTVSDELCMDKLIELRNKLKPVFELESVKLSFLPFFIKALSLAMKTFPVLNSRLNEAGTELTYLSAHNIGIAVDSKIGLLVPNIKNVETLSLFDIAQQLNGIIERARVGKLTNAELSNGSISVSNIGALGGITATPVINKPDVAIVALGKTQKLPRFTENGEVFASSIMMVNWSGDHRVIDGATMVKFNNLWMDYLCHPEIMLVHLR
ncbi:MAG: 2-oxoisovalerate dehydrogenase E2 component (dihydrolipoyl transacylase) [Alphaproteobacteria bacterium]|jgi:2-oxoisovalerate dehydrogenase E2 component (dihydrolipoyl transacylase)